MWWTDSLVNVWRFLTSKQAVEWFLIYLISGRISIPASWLKWFQAELSRLLLNSKPPRCVCVLRNEGNPTIRSTTREYNLYNLHIKLNFKKEYWHRFLCNSDIFLRLFDIRDLKWVVLTSFDLWRKLYCSSPFLPPFFSSSSSSSEFDC